MVKRRLFRSIPVVLLLVVAFALPVFAAVKAKPAGTPPKIDPKAVQMLRQMSEYVNSLQSFSVRVNTTRDLMLPTDQALTSDMSYDLMVKRPNALRVNMTSAAGGAQVFYDGYNLTVYTPTKNYYAITPAAATIGQAIRQATRRGISMPLAEFIGGNARSRLLSNMTSATFVGASLVGGVMTNHLAFRQKTGIDWQVWIQDGDAPLPIRLMIIDRKAKDAPRYTASLSDWNTNASFSADTFTFTAPQGARQINFKELPKPRGFRQAPAK